MKEKRESKRHEKMEKNCPCHDANKVKNFDAFNTSMSNANKINLGASAVKTHKKS